MTTETETLEEKFLAYIKKISHFEESIGLMAWDLRTGAPRKGASQRSEVLGTLSSEVFAMSTSQELKGYLEGLREPSVWSKLTEVTKGSVEECEKQLKKYENIPPQEFKEYVILTSNAEVAWEKAKNDADFKTFQPYLEKIVDYNRKYTEWVGYKGNKYNALLDDYEPGLTVDIIDDVFGKLKKALVPLVKEITEAKDQPQTDFLFQPFPPKNQEALSREI